MIMASATSLRKIMSGKLADRASLRPPLLAKCKVARPLRLKQVNYQFLMVLSEPASKRCRHTTRLAVRRQAFAWILGDGIWNMPTTLALIGHVFLVDSGPQLGLH